MSEGQNKVHLSKQDELDKQKYLEELDAQKDKLENGPIMNRNCTDVICCLLFVIFMGGFVVGSAYGWMNGDPMKLTIGWDSDRNGCGLTEGYEDYQYLYWPNAPTLDVVDQIKEGDVSGITALLNQGVCVKACPQGDTTPIECKPTSSMIASTNFMDSNGEVTCTYNINASFLESLGISIEEYSEATGVDANVISFPFRYKTSPYGGFCLPDVEESLGDIADAAAGVMETFYTDIVGDTGTKAMADIAAAWQVIAVCAVTALILGYLFLFILSWIAGAVIYIFLLVTFLSFVIGGYFARDYALSMPEEDSYNTWIEYGAYALWALGGIFLCCVCCCWGAIKVAVAVYKTTAQYVRANLRIFLLPLFAWIFQVVWGLVWMFCAIYVFSVGEPEAREDPWSFLTHVKWSDTTRYIFWYQIFGLFWIAAFINGMCQFIIAGSSCIWYFTVNTDTKGRGTVGTAFKWGFRYHMGTVAFGSFCIAVIQTIRLLFEWYRRMINRASKENKVVKAIMCITSYCLYILEKCVKYISKNAYIQCALTNAHFCKAALNAFALIIANAARFGWATSVGAIMNYFGILCIGSINTLGAYLFLTNTTYFSIQSPIAPCVLVGLISLFISNTFMSIFGFSSDAILQSFLLDESLKFKGASRPEYMQDFANALNNKGCC